MTRHLEDGAVPIDNDFIERQIEPWAMGKKAWLFCGCELAGQPAAIVMSLVQAKLNGHEPWAYLRGVHERLPSHPNSRIKELLPHCWKKPDARSSAGDSVIGSMPSRGHGRTLTIEEDSLTWPRIATIAAHWLPTPCILHPWFPWPPPDPETSGQIQIGPVHHR